MFSLLYDTVFPAIGNFMGFVGTWLTMRTENACWYIAQGIAVDLHLFDYTNIFTGEVLRSPHAPAFISQIIGDAIITFVEKLEVFVPTIWDVPFWVTCIFVSMVVVAFAWVVTAVFKLLF